MHAQGSKYAKENTKEALTTHLADLEARCKEEMV